MKKVVVYVDGSSVDVNAGINKQNKAKGVAEILPEWHGAYAGVFMVDGVEVLRMRGYERGGTIGKMELTALVNAMHKCLGYNEATIYSDSQYIVNGAMNWLGGWRKKQYNGIKFPELWELVSANLHGACSFGIRWVKGHNGTAGNEKVDELARRALGEGITEWKVKGTERWVKFDTTEVNEFSMPTGYMNSEQHANSLLSGPIGINGNFKKMELPFRETITSSETFPEMVKSKPSLEMQDFKRQEDTRRKNLEEDDDDYYGAIADYRKSHPIDYDHEIASCYNTINNMIKRIAQLTIEKEKQNGTYSTRDNG